MTGSILGRLAAVVLLTAFLFGLNFHLVFMQAFGWSGMLLENHRESGSWFAAIEQTLEGATPCSVCRQVETALNTDERRADPLASGADNRIIPPLLILLAKSTPALDAPAITFLPLETPGKLPPTPFSDSPVPPPRLAGA
jgi:hypothetical protein